MGVLQSDRLPTSIQVQRRASGLPCAMALRLIRDRPGDRLSCHHRPSEALASSELDASTGGVGPKRFHRTQGQRSSVAALRPPLPVPRLRRWPTPLWRDRLAGVLLLICPTCQSIYFRFFEILGLDIISDNQK